MYFRRLRVIVLPEVLDAMFYHTFDHVTYVFVFFNTGDTQYYTGRVLQ